MLKNFFSKNPQILIETQANMTELTKTIMLINQLQKNNFKLSQLNGDGSWHPLIGSGLNATDMEELLNRLGANDPKLAEKLAKSGNAQKLLEELLKWSSWQEFKNKSDKNLPGDKSSGKNLSGGDVGNKVDSKMNGKLNKQSADKPELVNKINKFAATGFFDRFGNRIRPDQFNGKIDLFDKFGNRVTFSGGKGHPFTDKELDKSLPDEIVHDETFNSSSKGKFSSKNKNLLDEFFDKNSPATKLGGKAQPFNKGANIGTGPVHPLNNFGNKILPGNRPPLIDQNHPPLIDPNRPPLINQNRPPGNKNPLRPGLVHWTNRFGGHELFDKYGNRVYLGPMNGSLDKFGNKVQKVGDKYLTGGNRVFLDRFGNKYLLDHYGNKHYFDGNSIGDSGRPKPGNFYGKHPAMNNHQALPINLGNKLDKSSNKAMNVVINNFPNYIPNKDTDHETIKGLSKDPFKGLLKGRPFDGLGKGPFYKGPLKKPMAPNKDLNKGLSKGKLLDGQQPNKPNEEDEEDDYEDDEYDDDDDEEEEEEEDDDDENDDENDEVSIRLIYLIMFS